MTTPPNGFFRCISLSGRESLGFHCATCKLVVYHGIGERGIWHCGSFQKPPAKVKNLPVFKIQRPASSGLVGEFNNRRVALIGFD